jgi:hypothetical protein
MTGIRDNASIVANQTWFCFSVELVPLWISVSRFKPEWNVDSKD